MGLFDMISKNLISSGFLSEKGDELNIRVTDSDRRVTKASRRDGSKVSFTEYKTGTVVKTETFKKKK